MSLVFPAWNESQCVELAISGAHRALRRFTSEFEIIVVDDASTDDTAEQCRELQRTYPQLRLLENPVNLKLGCTLRTGFAAAINEIVVYSDIDLPIDFAEIPRAVRLLDELGVEMICAYRLDRTAEGFRRWLYSTVYNAVIRASFKVKVRDVNFGFKVFRKRLLDEVQLESTSSFIDAELVIKAVKSGFRVAQIGVDYFPRTRGTSTLGSLSVVPGLLRDLIRLRPGLTAPRRTLAASPAHPEVRASR